MVAEGARQSEQGEQGRQPEILDWPKYGTLYLRFLLASQAKTTGEIANIINTANTIVEFDLTTDTLMDRNYNPVFENFSLAERKKQWEGREFSDAYSQWRTEFTGFMINIQDPKRELALKAILSNNKEAKEFTVNDADTLFNKFCKGKSDITNFIERVTTNLVSDGKINPTNLQELLPHLEWIASGLFGKNTSSYGVTRLIEIESAIRNNPGQVMEIFNSNKQRINTPIDDEKRVLLGLLYSYLSKEEKIIPTQVSETVTIEATPQPAPVTIDEDELPTPPPNVSESKHVPEPPAPTETLEPAIVVSPAPPVKETTLDIPAAPPDEGVISLEGKDDLLKELNERLQQNQSAPNITFAVSPDLLKEYITFMEKDYKVQTGTIEVDKPNNKIIIKKVQIKKGLGEVTFDLAITNSANGITADIQNYNANLAAKMFGGNVKDGIKDINFSIKERLNEQIAPDNPLWMAGNISISEGNFLIRFEKLPL